MSEENNGSEKDGGMVNGRWERIEHNMEFIVRHQAQFSADLERMREVQVQYEREWRERWTHTETGIRSLLAIAEIHEREIGELREAQAQTDEQMKDTDDRLNALIDIVDRDIGERRNGDPDPKEPTEPEDSEAPQ